MIRLSQEEINEFRAQVNAAQYGFDKSSNILITAISAICPGCEVYFENLIENMLDEHRALVEAQCHAGRYGVNHEST